MGSRELKHFLTEKIPRELQLSVEASILFPIIDEKNIKSINELKTFLKDEIQNATTRFKKESPGGTHYAEGSSLRRLRQKDARLIDLYKKALALLEHL